MATITIDDKEYDLDTMSEEAKAQLASIQYVDSELARLSMQVAAYQTARIGYSNELKKHLDVLAGDTIKFN